MSTRSRNWCLRTAGAWAFGIAISLSACAPTTEHVYVSSRPPAPVYEVRGVPPGPGYVWVEGYHRWDGRAYVWVPGRWDRGPQARAVWVPGRWVQDKHGWYYVQGHWR